MPYLPTASRRLVQKELLAVLKNLRLLKLVKIGWRDEKDLAGLEDARSYKQWAREFLPAAAALPLLRESGGQSCLEEIKGSLLVTKEPSWHRKSSARREKGQRAKLVLLDSKTHPAEAKPHGLGKAQQIKSSLAARVWLREFGCASLAAREEVLHRDGLRIRDPHQKCVKYQNA